MKGCDRCEFGWRVVSEVYVLAQAPLPATVGLPDDIVAVMLADVELKRAGLRGSVYPCRECQPTLFFRWANKHLERDHDSSSCDECQDIRRGASPSPRRSRPSAIHDNEPPIEERERRDLQ